MWTHRYLAAVAIGFFVTLTPGSCGTPAPGADTTSPPVIPAVPEEQNADVEDAEAGDTGDGNDDTGTGNAEPDASDEGESEDPVDTDDVDTEGDSGDGDHPGDGGEGDAGSGPGGADTSTLPDFTVYPLPECEVIPGGSLTGADSLTVWVAVRNSGPGDWGSLVPWAIVSDTGLQGGGNTALSTGSSFTAMQVDLAAGDYSRTHRFVVTVDPRDEIAERDENNNAIAISVSLPSAPPEYTPVSCSVAQ